MKYSKLHSKNNPISAARLDEAFKASTMEGGPGDPEKKTKVTKKVSEDKQSVTVSRESFSKEPNTKSTKKAESNQSYFDSFNNPKDISLGFNPEWDPSGSEFKKYTDEKSKVRDFSSFNYKKLKGLDHKIDFPLENEDLTLDPTEHIPDEYRNPPGGGSGKTTYSTTEKEKKKKKDTVKHPPIKGSGLETCTSDDPTSCGLDPNKAQSEVRKATSEREKLEKKAQQDPTKATFNPKKWFEEKMAERSINKAKNQTTTSRRKKNRQANKASKRRMKGKLPTNNPLSRTIAGQF